MENHRRIFLRRSAATVLTVAGAAYGAGARAAADPIKLGQSLPMTGPQASYGQAKQAGTLLYIAKANAAGGIKGRQIKLITLDDAYDPARAVANTRELASAHGVVGFTGYLGIPAVAATLPVFDELKIPVVGVTSGSRAVREPFKPYVFPVRAALLDETRRVVGHLKLLSLLRVAVIFQDNPFGRFLRDEFLAAAQEQGLASPGTIAVAADGKNAAAALDRVPSGTQAVFLATLSGPAVELVIAITDARRGLQVYGCSPIDGTLIAKLAGAKARGLGLSQAVPVPTNRSRLIVRQYLDALREHAPAAAPTYFGLEGFIEMKIVALALSQAADPLTPAAFKRALEGLGRIDLGDFEVEYGPRSRRGSLFTELTVLGNGGDFFR